MRINFLSVASLLLCTLAQPYLFAAEQQDRAMAVDADRAQVAAAEGDDDAFASEPPADLSLLDDEIADPSVKGPYQVAFYASGLLNFAYSSAMIFYPKGRGPFPATTLTGGLSNTKENMMWLGQHLASHGIITIVFSPTNLFSMDANVWARGHVAAIAMLKKENRRSNSPVVGLINENQLGLLGYSYGASGSIIAAEKLGDQVKSVIPICAYLPKIPRIDTPFFFITGSFDIVASPLLVEGVFNATRIDAPKAFVKISGLDHFSPINFGSKHKELAHFITAWSKVFLEGDSGYETYLKGDKVARQLVNSRTISGERDYQYTE